MNEIEYFIGHKLFQQEHKGKEYTELLVELLKWDCQLESTQQSLVKVNHLHSILHKQLIMTMEKSVRSLVWENIEKINKIKNHLAVELLKNI